MTAVVDMVGQRFARLVVLERAGKSHRGLATWRCQCDCGTEFVSAGANIRHGITRSCGCLVSDLRHARATHGQSGNGTKSTQTGAYGSWRGMRQRCDNPRCRAYVRYGGRGIRYSERWADFENFFEDMGPRPEGYSLERLDCNGDYEPGNCIWIPRGDQSINRRVTKWVTLDGEKVHQAEASRRLGLKPDHLLRWRTGVTRFPPQYAGRLEFLT